MKKKTFGNLIKNLRKKIENKIFANNKNFLTH